MPLSDAGDRRIGNRAHNSVVILLDESGDLGCSPRSSRHFVVAAMVISDSGKLDRLTKNVRKKLGKKECVGELKFNNAMDPTRELILRA